MTCKAAGPVTFEGGRGLGGRRVRSALATVVVAATVFAWAPGFAQQDGGAATAESAEALSQRGMALVKAQKFVEAVDVFQHYAAAVRQGKGEDAPEYAQALTLLSRLLQVVGRPLEAEPLARQILALEEKNHGPDDPAVAVALNNLASLLQVTNRPAEAEPLYRRSLAINEKNHGAEDVRVARDLNALGLLLKQANRLEEAEKLIRRALAIDEKKQGPDHQDVGSDLTTLAAILKETGRLAEAETLLRRSVALYEKGFGSDALQVAAPLSNLAQVLQARSRLAEAEPLARRALMILQKTYGPAHPSVAMALNNLASLLQALNRYAEAEPLMRLALTISQQMQGAEHPATATAMNNLASLLQAMGRYAEAEPLMRQTLAIDEKSLGADHAAVGRDLNNLASLLQVMGRYAEAEPPMRRALSIKEKSFGPDSPQIAIALSNLATLLQETNRLADSEALARRALAILDRSPDSGHPSAAIALNNLASLLQATNRFAEAEPLMRRVLALDEKNHGPEHPASAVALNNLASLLQATNRFAEAEPLMRRALAIDEKSYGPEHPDAARDLGNLAQLLQATNRFAEAEPLARRALAIDEKILGADHPAVARDLSTLALLFQATNRLAEAEPLRRRALAIDEKNYGADHPAVARALNNLAVLFRSMDRPDELEPLHRRALAIDEKSYGADHPGVAIDLNNLGTTLLEAGRPAEAEPLLRRSLAINEKSYGTEHPQVAVALGNLAALLQRDPQRSPEAEPLARRALAINEKSYGAEHPDVALAASSLAWSRARQGDWSGALQNMRRSTAISVINARRLRDGGGEGEKRLLSQSASRFKDHVRMAFQAARADAAVRDEAFGMAQRASASDAAGALAQASVRFARGGDGLAALVREQQDLARQREASDKVLIAALSRGDRGAADAARAAQARLDARLGDIAARLARAFPDYAALVNPEPLTIAGAQALLAPDEALVQFVDMPSRPNDQAPETAYAFVITRSEARWVELPFGSGGLADRVTALRCGLDSSSWRDRRGLARVDGPAAREPQDPRSRCARLLGRTASEEDLPPFDLGRAYDLYHDLFGQVEDAIKGRRLLIAPSGALTQLPFQVLVVAPPSPAEGAEAYAGAQWLGARQAIAVLPSAASLAVLRKTKQGSASDPFAGFGNPLLNGGGDRRAWDRQDCARAAPPQSGRRSASRAAAPSLEDVFRGAVANVDLLRQASPLPETADELCAVARYLGAPESAVHLGERATVGQVKALSESGALSRVRTIHFATHGLVAGETAWFVRNRAEPALLLTPPAKDKASADDDGLLKASDVTGLRLNAEWVIMSACNTAAAGAEGGEALSGLARAFFYAGARSLLVSHWYVRSDAAVDITTGAFAALKADPRIGRAEALRRSLAALIAKGGDHAHPSVWAPFVLVGDEGRIFAATAAVAPPAAGGGVRRLKYNGPVRFVVFSPDGRRVAAAGVQGDVRVWDAAGGAGIGVGLPEGGSAQAVNALAFSDDGRRLVAATADDGVREWDAATGKVLRQFSGIGGAARSFTFSADGRLLAAVEKSKASFLTIWETANGRSRLSINASGGRGFSRESVVFSPDGRHVAAEVYARSEASPSVGLWNAGSGTMERLFKDVSGDVRSLAFSGDGRRLAMANAKGVVAVWDAGTGDRMFAAAIPPAAARRAALSPDGRRLAVAGADHAVKVWDLPAGRPLNAAASQADEVNALAFSPDGRTLALGGADGVIELRDVSSLSADASSQGR